MRYGGTGVDSDLARRTAAASELLKVSYAMCQAQRDRACIEAARAALRLVPTLAEAWNNIAAAYEAMGQWDEAIDAAQQALRINPDFQLAKNNLAWSESQKRLKVVK